MEKKKIKTTKKIKVDPLPQSGSSAESEKSKIMLIDDDQKVKSIEKNRADYIKLKANVAKAEKLSKKRSSRGMVAASIIAFALVVGILGTGLVTSTLTRINYSRSLENVYERSFYELVQNINNIEVSLSKAVVTNDSEAEEKLFYELWQQSEQTSSNLSRLPLSHTSIQDTTAFVNQLGGFSYYLMNKSAEGEVYTEADRNSLNELHTVSLYIQKVLNDYAMNLEQDYSILDDISEDFDASNISTTFGTMQDPSVEYPTLIYDGPFSDSMMNQEVKGLATSEVTETEATEIVTQAFSDENISDVKFLGLMNAKIKVYNFELTTTANKKIYAQISQRGGFLIAFSSYASSNIDNLELEECNQIALDFAAKQGLENMEVVWGTKVNNIAYINITTSIDGVIIYPEMIKLKVSTDDGSIIGWEATSYAYNKSERDLDKAALTEEEAKAKVSSMLEVVNARLSIIPVEYKSDLLCYEFEATMNNYTYYVYINALTGVQENILRVVSTVSGNLLQ